MKMPGRARTMGPCALTLLWLTAVSGHAAVATQAPLCEQITATCKFCVGQGVPQGDCSSCVQVGGCLYCHGHAPMGSCSRETPPVTTLLARDLMLEGREDAWTESAVLPLPAADLLAHDLKIEGAPPAPHPHPITHNAWQMPCRQPRLRL